MTVAIYLTGDGVRVAYPKKVQKRGWRWQQPFCHVHLPFSARADAFDASPRPAERIVLRLAERGPVALRAGKGSTMCN